MFSHAQIRSPSRTIFSIGAVLAVLCLGAGCETTPPVQEMSDARQAIEVARAAGAESHAKVELYEALQYLESAQQELNAAEFVQARRDALLAKAKAQEARKRSDAKQPR